MRYVNYVNKCDGELNPLHSIQIKFSNNNEKVKK
jgi:hypothetical protein